jgi:hypothetical protein
MATNDMGPGPLKKARRLVKKITQKVTKGTFLENPKNAPGEKNNPFAQKGGTTKKYQKGGPMVAPTTGSGSVANFIKERSPLKPKPKKIGLKDNRLKSGIKMQKGGKTTSFTDDIATGLDNVFRKTYPFNIPHTKVTKALKAVDDKITKGHEGEQPDWYNKFKDKVKKTMHVPLKKNQKGGSADGPMEARRKIMGEKKPSLKKTLRYVKKNGSGLILKDPNKAPAGWSTPEESTPSTRRYQKGGTGPIPKAYPTGNKGIKGMTRPQIGDRSTITLGNTSYANPPKPSMNAAGYVAKPIDKFGNEEAALDAKAIQKKGGATKKMQAGGISKGRNISQKAAERKTAKGKGYISSIMGANPSGDKGKYIPFTRAGRKDGKTKGMVSSKEMKPSRQIMKTGGMVNANANLKATATAGSRGVKSGINPKAAASKVVRGRVGGTSVAPKKAIPKASYGMSMSKMQMGGGTGDRTRTLEEITITAPKKSKRKPKAQYGMSTVSDNTRVTKSVAPNKRISKVSTSKTPMWSKDTAFDYKLPTGRRDNRVFKEGIKVKKG